MLDDYRAPLSSNFRLVQEQANPQHRLQDKTIAPAVCFVVEQKRKSPHGLLLSGCLCVLVFLFLAAPALSADVTLAWDPNSEADLEGYGVYFKLGESSPPYDLAGYVTLQELNDPNNPAFSIIGLEKGSSYYFAVTAYDAAGNESAYSTPVCAQIGDQILPCASSDGSGGSGSSGGSSGSSGGSSGSSGGGGGGCFIETSSDHQNKPGILMVTLLLLGSISLMRFRLFLNIFKNNNTNLLPLTRKRN
jgi:uncharacterized membrane protein YgcG